MRNEQEIPAIYTLYYFDTVYFYLKCNVELETKKKKSAEEKKIVAEKDESNSDDGQYKEKEVNRDTCKYDIIWNVLFVHPNATRNVSFAWYDLGPLKEAIPKEIDFDQTYSIPVNDTERASIGKKNSNTMGKPTRALN